MKKVYLLTACVLALSLSACDSKEQNQTTTKTDTPTTPVEPTQNIEPTTPAATAPFAINITDIKDFYGFSLSWSRIHLLDKDDKFLKTIELNNQIKPQNEWITTAKFENLTAGNEYKVCLQTFNVDRLENGNTPETSKICDYYLTNGDNLSKTQKQIFNAGLDKKMVLPKNFNLLVILTAKVQNCYPEIHNKTDLSERFVKLKPEDDKNFYFQKTSDKTNIFLICKDKSDHKKITFYNPNGEYITKTIDANSDDEVLSIFAATNLSFDVKKIDTINF